MKKAILVFALLAGCASAAGFTPTTMTDRDQKELQKALRQHLKDPLSAQVEQAKVFVTPKGQRMICGQYNAKNAFGGYIGFQTFSIPYSPQYDTVPIMSSGMVADIDCNGAGYNLK